MKKKKINIKPDQYISDVIQLIPSNVIIEKPTGSGITQKALSEDRHGIIIEPNRPVIQGKCQKFNKGNTRKLTIRGVYEDISVSEVVEYLQSDIEYKKIITTPESFIKVKEAFKELNMLERMYNDYFLLFDECEKTIQDIDYRDGIIKPMDDFFLFKHKAFVSATPILPRDPRFVKQKFRHLIFKPTKPATQTCELTITNNTLYSFKKYLEATRYDRYFIFLNSTKAIVTFMNYMDIKNETLIFCSRESKNKLDINKYKNVRETLVNSEKFAKYNFFTSRFNSAVDIDGIIEPNVVIITDLFLAEHTRVDPFSEVQQIIGRFRKPQHGEIIRRLAHITNISSVLISSTEEEILKDIEVFNKLHLVLTKFRDAATSSFAKTVVDEMLFRSEFSNYINDDGSTNYYMIDNAIFNNMVNRHYQSGQNLIEAYNKTSAFELKIEQQEYQLTDEHKAKLKASNKLKSSLELLLPVLNELEQRGLENFDVQLQLKQIEKEHPTAFRTFKVIGFEKAAELGFSYHKVMLELNRIEAKTQYGHFGFLSYLQEEFKVGESYSFGTIKKKLSRGIDRFNLQKLRPNSKLLEMYFDLTPRIYIGNMQGKKHYKYMVVRRRFNTTK